MSQNLDLSQLLEVAPVKRDMQWEQAFLQALPQVNFEILNEAPQTGPDGWPYLMVKISPEGTQPAAKVLAWLSERGIGLAVNPDKAAPDYVLSYGMIWNFRQNSRFLSDMPTENPAAPEFKPGTKVHAGAPSPEYLPQYVREILRTFFTDNKVQAMKVLVMSSDTKHYDLCFSAECLGNPSPEESQNVLEAVSWFLPPHYSLMVVSEQGLPPFHPI